MNDFKKGILLSLVLGFTVLFLFFGPILKDPNQVYFAPSGDGLKSYYGAIYHLKYDSSYFQFKGMNYPYGESVFFTDNQPLLTNTVKWISNNVVDIRGNMIGIINLSMIFSILIAAIFLFLLFFELGVSWWFGSLASIGICMLSPQIGRMGGHFSLAHLFWIPWMLYLIFRFSKKPGWRLSIVIALVGFLAASMHLYFAGFYGLLLTFYWLFAKNWFKASWLDRRKAFLYWFVQVCVPFILLELIMASTDHMSDRTTHPYGFLVYLAHPVSVFFPSGVPYSFVPKYITVFRHLDWEALAFIGVSALIGFLIGLVYFVIKLAKGKAFLKISDNQVLTIFFWASMAALLLSFGIPFKLGLEWLVDYIGPFRQLRALSRFSWLFYYVINVLIFYQLHQWFVIQKKRPLAFSVLILAFIFLFVDGYYNVKGTASKIANRKPLLEDKTNLLPENKWVNQLDVSQFQAILPIPYFHVGSENIWIEPGFNSLENTLIASLKTGLPTTGVMMGRTSISQTYRNYSMVIEPNHDYEVLNDYKNEKDILLIRMKGYQPNRDEQRLLDATSFITGNDQFDLLRLPFASLKQIPANYQKLELASFKAEALIEKNNLLLSDTSSFMFYQSYEDETAPAFSGKGAHQLRVLDWNTLLEKKLVGTKKGDSYLASFWLKDFKRDAYPRFVIEINQTDDSGKSLNYFFSDIHPYIRAIDQNWAMFEFPVSIQEDNVSLKISVKNEVLRHADYVIDELLVHKSNCDLFQEKDGFLIKNTRKFRIQ
jgi:hypothetical protein